MKYKISALSCAALLLGNSLLAQTVKIVNWPPPPPCASDTLSIGANVTGGAANSFQWSYRLGASGPFVNFEDTTGIITGSTQSVLEILQVKPWMNGSYIQVEAILPDTTLSDTTEGALALAAPPSPLTTIISNDTGICPGQSLRLTASGGVSGPGTSIAWYRGDPTTSNTTFLGRGNVYDAGQAGNYFVRRENACGNSSAISITLSAFTVSTPPNAVASPDSICQGKSVVLSASGGTAGTGSSIFWRTAPNGGGALVGQGPSISVAPASTTTYYARREGVCNASADDPANVAVIAQLNLLIDGLPAPERIEAREGEEFSLQFSSPISGASYQWRLSLEEGSVANALPVEGSGSSLSQEWALENNSDSALILCEVVISARDCQDSSRFLIAIYPILFIPNILTPNGDALNDTWLIRPAASNPADEFRVKLYNRQGICVWGCNEGRTAADAAEWDGGSLPDGPYWYLIEGPASFSQKGALTILRP